jgi:type II secretory ATPase GspE/PulE/Tfp pilus assembly ATPase PilB-like protein
MGLTADELNQMESLIHRPQGIMLVTGPTGSGKTTTLYGILNRIKSVEKNITTIEDPVEYEIGGINQVAIQEKIGMTFASTLRSMLRQDPDIIMVGEMRDLEMVSIAMQAALTGHFVLSTIHTNSCTATITRLRNLGAPSYLIASTINCIMAQRLVRVICTKCRVQYEPPEHDLVKIGFHGKKRKSDFKFFRGEGCSACEGTGYKGRIGLFEILPFTQPIRDLVVANAPESALRQQAIASGMLTLARGALEKVKAGVTTLDELFRVVEMEEDFGAICSECHGLLGADFVMCPHCGHSLQATCPACRKTLSPDWKFCPYCRHNVAKQEAGHTFA